MEFAAGAVFGIVYSDVKIGLELDQVLLMFPLGLGITTTLASLKVFGAERVVFWREAALGSGMCLNSGAYTLAKCVVDVPRLFILSVFFIGGFYPFASPLAPFSSCVANGFAAVWSASGFAYLVSVIFEKSSAQLVTVIMVMFLTTFAGVLPSLSKLQDMGLPFYMR